MPIENKKLEDLEKIYEEFKNDPKNLESLLTVQEYNETVPNPDDESLLKYPKLELIVNLLREVIAKGSAPAGILLGINGMRKGKLEFEEPDFIIGLVCITSAIYLYAALVETFNLRTKTLNQQPRFQNDLTEIALLDALNLNLLKQFEDNMYSSINKIEKINPVEVKEEVPSEDVMKLKKYLESLVSAFIEKPKDTSKTEVINNKIEQLKKYYLELRKIEEVPIIKKIPKVYIAHKGEKLPLLSSVNKRRMSTTHATIIAAIDEQTSFNITQFNINKILKLIQESINSILVFLGLAGGLFAYVGYINTILAKEDKQDPLLRPAPAIVITTLLLGLAFVTASYNSYLSSYKNRRRELLILRTQEVLENSKQKYIALKYMIKITEQINCCLQDLDDINSVARTPEKHLEFFKNLQTSKEEIMEEGSETSLLVK